MVGARLRGTGIYNTGCVTMVGARLPGILQGVSQWWEPGYQVYYRACHNGGSQATRYITGRVTMVGARLPGILQGVSQWWEPD